jgi:CHAT domain-containing protein/Flp pilus assembly protein TadD
VGDRGGEATTLNNIGLVYDDLGEKQKALDYYNQALPLYRAVGNRGGEAKTLNNIGTVYNALGEKQKALDYYNQALPLYRAVGNRGGEAKTLNNIGTVYDALGEKQKALDYYNQALPLRRAVGDRGGEATTLNNIGAVYDALGEKQKALDYFNQALPLYRAVSNRSGEATTLNNIGAVYDSLGEKQKALDYYNQAFPLYRAVGDRGGEATTLNNIGLVYNALGKKQKALDYYNQALPLYRAVGDRGGEATTLNNIGAVYDALGEKQKALDYYNQALPIRRALGDRGGEATTLNNIGTVYDSLGEKQKALDYYNQALPLYRAVGDRGGEATTLNNIGLVYDSLGEKQKALDYFNQALPLFRAVGDRSGEAVTLHNIASALNKQQPDVSIVFYKQSVNLYESLRKDIRKLPRETQETYAKSVSKTYRRLADALLAQGRIGEAQEVMELLKIQELNTVTSETRSAPTPAQIALNSLEQEIANKYTSLVDFGQQLSDCETKRCSRLSEYTNQYKELTKVYAKFIEEIKQKLTEARLTEVDESTKKFIAQANRIVTVQPNSILIYPLVLPDKIRILWATKGGALDQAECPLSEAQLSKLVEDFRTALQTTDDLNPVQKTGQQLHNCLLPEKLRTVLKTNKIENLIFVPDRVTNYIPMAALHDGKNYLIETYSVANILAASYTDTTDKLPKTPTILGFGLSNAVTLSNPTRNFSPLPFVPSELDAIIQPQNNPQKGIFPGQQWLDRDFTLDRLTTGLLDKPNILHIATHGEFVATDPKSSYLVLGDSTPYALSQVEYLRNLSNIHLVVLSACETALGGRDRNGLEVAGISAYFLGDPSRAKAVLASLWKVNDPATSILMSQFYTTLNATNLSKSQALRQVQRNLIDSKLTLKDAADRAGVRLYEPNKKRPQNLSHPYYWAPFILIGNSQ